MSIKNLILQDLENELNTNAQSINFVIGRPAVLYNSNFVIERFGDPDNNSEENWYEVITEDFVPVMVNSFSAGYLAQPNVRALSADMILSFLIPFETEPVVLTALNSFVDALPGKKSTNTPILNAGYNVVYNSTLPEFAEVVLYNDIRFIQYNISINAFALEETFSLHNIKVELYNEDVSNDYIELPIIAYVPNRMRDSTTIQEPNTSSTKSVIKNSAWTASIQLILSLKTAFNPLTAEILKILEDSSELQNKVFLLRVTYELSNYEAPIKSIIISGVQTNFTRDDIATVTLMVEEAYSILLPTQPAEVL